jgi:multidrug resistance efflux pump
MLNISENSVNEQLDKSSFPTFARVEKKVSKKVLSRVILITLIITLVILFLPWTQNIRSIGNVNTKSFDQRPQALNSIIAGRIEKWFVKEGDLVQKGDTLLQISEIKDEYFDSELLSRTDNQRVLKEQSVGAYNEKIKALDSQISALNEQLELKLQQTTLKFKQAKLKTEIDSNLHQAAIVNTKIAKEQFKRMEELYKQGLKSLTDYEARNLKLQQSQAYEVEALNKWMGSKNDIINAKVEYSSVRMDYQNSVAKASSDKSSAYSDKFDAEATVTKLKNQYANYKYRLGSYYITAPQDGYITKSLTIGIGETIKEGDALVTIMPAKYDLMVEMYINPIDLPLVKKGNEVMLQFDGWPAIIFSGWPNASYGTFRGEVYAIDNYISENSKFRVLIKPKANMPAWPKQIRPGGGIQGMMLLDDVPIYYEVWRQINGFPPNYYTGSSMVKTKVKK